jgi:hypothetical protein
MESGKASAGKGAQGQGQPASKGFGVVYSVILDETHEYLKNREDVVGNEASYIGCILFKLTSQPASDKVSLPVAYPFDKNFKNIPVRNETVEIYESPAGVTLYRRIGSEISPNAQADEALISTTFPEVPIDSDISKNIKKNENSGIPRSNINENKKYDGLGDYFKRTPGIHRLKLYEGDTLIESRFGQSIRFSGYNNPGKQFSPSIIIRNNENTESRKKVVKFGVEEDINRDGTIIAITSDQYELPFQPGIIDEKGKSNFETKPDSFFNYPQKLNGDQVLVNSGRILLSAKTGELIFYSKKDYGFISDGGMSIDNKLGLDISLKDDFNVITNDRNVAFHTGKGSIFLGNENLEPLVKGQTLVDILGELIDALANQQYLTPSGPSKVGPENVPTLAKIKSKLNTILSKLNQTS